jgi:uncharacterized membrane protein
MTRIENSIEIGVSPQQVWQYIWQPNNLPNYLPISDVKVLDAKDDFVELSHKFTAAGRTMDLVCEARSAESNTKMIYRTKKGMALQGTWLLEPVGNGTSLKYTLEYVPPGGVFGKILDKFQIKKEMNRISVEGLQKLKEILEK